MKHTTRARALRWGTEAISVQLKIDPKRGVDELDGDGDLVRLVYCEGRSIGENLAQELSFAPSTEDHLVGFLSSSKLACGAPNSFYDASLQGIEDVLAEQGQYLAASIIARIRGRPGVVARIQLYEELARYACGGAEATAIRRCWEEMCWARSL